MQLLRAARAACTNLNLRVTSIGSSLSLGPIFSTATITWREDRFCRRKKIVLGIQEKRLAANIMLTRLAPIN